MTATLQERRTTRRRNKALSFNPGRPAWKEPASPLYNFIKAVIVGGISLSIVIPILLVVSTSLADDKQAARVKNLGALLARHLAKLLA